MLLKLEIENKVMLEAGFWSGRDYFSAQIEKTNDIETTKFESK